MQALSCSLACLLFATLAQVPPPGPVVIPARPQPGQPIPWPPRQASPVPAEPLNLVGIVSLPSWTMALLANPADSDNTYFMEVGDRREENELVEIDGKAGRVRLRYRGEPRTLTLAKTTEGSNHTVHMQAA